MGKRAGPQRQANPWPYSINEETSSLGVESKVLTRFMDSPVTEFKLGCWDMTVSYLAILSGGAGKMKGGDSVRGCFQSKGQEA